MADYKQMYFKLLNEIEETIEKLKEALNKAEDIYIETSKDDE